MKGILINVGNIVEVDSLDENWQINYIPERKEYHEFGLLKHKDPEFLNFTYGDYPYKNPRVFNLRHIVAGDYIFFHETFKIHASYGRFVIGYFRILVIKTYHGLKREGLLTNSEYSSNAHVRRNLHIPDSDEVFTLFKGDKDSSLLQRPLPLDRKLIEEIDLRNRKGEPIKFRQGESELQRINYHTRASRLLSHKQVSILLHKIRSL